MGQGAVDHSVASAVTAMVAAAGLWRFGRQTIRQTDKQKDIGVT